MASTNTHHHRALHHGEFTITGNPETGTLRFTDKWGQPIGPPPLGAHPLPPPTPTRLVYEPPTGERMSIDLLTWN